MPDEPALEDTRLPTPEGRRTLRVQVKKNMRSNPSERPDILMVVRQFASDAQMSGAVFVCGQSACRAIFTTAFKTQRCGIKSMREAVHDIQPKRLDFDGLGDHQRGFSSTPTYLKVLSILV
ncbi:hypothetical protein LGQ03_15355 [Loktanella sp. TSTF-M6]|uniref:Uncharacterized protein n=1 Tax=Loktanella gaetbuli TaxID=2881335 RepID=A0ABS8BYT4_9RHOB|nr:hypothetical protein [Loktanella gaetbuli]MCB5200616.1 hypothetical protein [Loktanella gaetbuli]